LSTGGEARLFGILVMDGALDEKPGFYGGVPFCPTNNPTVT
jgi:hypothetical protein